jgi:hypothetical protein
MPKMKKMFAKIKIKWNWASLVNTLTIVDDDIMNIDLFMKRTVVEPTK